MSTEPDKTSQSRREQFHAFRSRLNCRILGDDAARGTRMDGSVPMGATLVTKRFFALDTKTYEPGALDAKMKELLGLVASMVLRCDDCIAYHIDQCITHGATDEELFETFDIALIVGGSIVIPHLRRAVDFLDACRDDPANGSAPTCVRSHE
ncbi:MAG: carboxymuconolactone decarboxylase family protein [Phycisphaeraceae bacterium]|nr:carboxymuconolactone decarboxylase family protein [Phycisphaerales bacterium]MCB9859322.1 carboxymuconolactone decarboxylase family protein [Phycisphaeraceae bacterium]